MNKISGQDMLLSHPKFGEIFIIHADASKIQHWIVSVANGNSLPFNPKN